MAELFHTIQDDEQVLELIKCSDAALEKAAAELKSVKEKLARYEEVEKKVEALTVKAAEALVQFDRIAPGFKEKAASSLKDHVTALETLINTADPSITTRPRPIGARDVVKEASAGGNRKPTADEVFDLAMGLKF